LLAPRSTSKLEDHPLSTIRDCLHIFTATLHIWWAGTVQYNDWLYGLDGPVIESRWGEFFRTRPHRAWGPSSLLYNGYRVSFPEINRLTNHPIQRQVKERVELYLWIFVLSSRVSFTFSPSIFAVRFFTRNTRNRHAMFTGTRKLWRSR